MTRYDIAKFYGYNSPEEYDEAEKRKHEIYTESLKRQKPYIEKEPVNRGRWLEHHAIWIDQPRDEGWLVQAECSECGRRAHVMNRFTKSVAYEYCPHCGVRMIMDGDK